MIRFATAADIRAMLAIYAPYIRDTAITFEYAVPSAAEFARRWETVTTQFPWLVWEENGEILGYAYADRAFARAAYQWDADLSIYLRRDALGRGGGKRLYGVLEALLRRQGYRILYGLVTSSNTESCSFHEALGYRNIAFFPDCGYKFHRWYGLYWYEKRLDDTAPTAPPLSWRAVCAPSRRWFEEECSW